VVCYDARRRRTRCSSGLSLPTRRSFATARTFGETALCTAHQMMRITERQITRVLLAGVEQPCRQISGFANPHVMIFVSADVFCGRSSRSYRALSPPMSRAGGGARVLRPHELPSA